MENINKFLENLLGLLKAPVSGLLGILGAILVLMAFVEYGEEAGWSLSATPGTVRLVLGLLFLAAAVAVFFLSREDRLFHRKLNYVKGVKIKRDELTISICQGQIQELPNLTNDTAIVLPTNTVFTDECATDARTALGAFFIKHFPGDVAGLPAIFKESLDASGAIRTSDGHYRPGTTIILPERFARPAKIFITASTVRIDTGEIAGNPHIICNCVEEIFKQTNRQQIDTVNIPILGSGHGGVDKGLALLFMLLSILHFSKNFTHLKAVNIIVHPNDIEKLNKSKELRLIVAL